MGSSTVMVKGNQHQAIGIIPESAGLLNVKNDVPESWKESASHSNSNSSNQDPRNESPDQIKDHHIGIRPGFRTYKNRFQGRVPDKWSQDPPHLYPDERIKHNP